jgi:protein-S-isoprenylcysteine O-methyltransferase Ste14
VIVEAPLILLVALHALFWTVMSIARLRAWRASGSPPIRHADPAERSAPASRTLVVVHGVGLTLLYPGLALALRPGAPAWPLSGAREAIGAAAIVGGAWVAGHAMATLRSWRLRAALAPDHQLTTDGVFAWVRHPIYAALDLLALGTLLWAPHLVTAAAAALVVLGGDLRARAEERLLVAAYGDRYRAYAARTRRILPGLY